MSAKPAADGRPRSFEGALVGHFLRANWLYIAAPLVVLVVVLAVYVSFYADGSSPEVYKVY